MVPVARLLADPKVITTPDPDTVSPGFLGFAVVFLLAIATVLLIRSMVGHLRKVRFSPEPEDQSARTPESDRASGPGTSGPDTSGPGRTSGPGLTSGPA
jgi:hypothetical protein